jgi:hypothetical protein
MAYYQLHQYFRIQDYARNADPTIPEVPEAGRFTGTPSLSGYTTSKPIQDRTKRTEPTNPTETEYLQRRDEPGTRNNACSLSHSWTKTPSKGTTCDSLGTDSVVPDHIWSGYSTRECDRAPEGLDSVMEAIRTSHR